MFKKIKQTIVFQAFISIYIRNFTYVLNFKKEYSYLQLPTFTFIIAQKYASIYFSPVCVYMFFTASIHFDAEVFISINKITLLLASLYITYIIAKIMLFSSKAIILNKYRKLWTDVCKSVILNSRNEHMY
jgi:hypothetical protein